MSTNGTKLRTPFALALCPWLALACASPPEAQGTTTASGGATGGSVTAGAGAATGGRAQGDGGGSGTVGTTGGIGGRAQGGGSGTVSAGAGTSGGSNPNDEALVWADEFDGPAIQLANWGFDSGGGGWGNGELQVYTSATSNAFVQDGVLVIQALHSATGYTSARLVTRDKQRFRYGRIEARIKGPSSSQGLTDPGAWPAFWLLPQDRVYGAWPSSGEIDIWELGGLEPSVVSGAVHWNSSSTGAQSASYSRTRTLLAPAANDFHVYAITWSDTFIRWQVDGQEFIAFDHSAPLAGREPFKQDFYLVLNLAVGGSFGRTGAPNPANYPQSLYVDWVRYYR